MHRIGSWAALVAACLLFQPVAYAQAYPAKLVRIFAPFIAGGPVDIQARWAAQQLATALGQPFIVENRPGAGGILAADAVAKSAPDGYTLLIGNAGQLSIASSVRANLPYDVLQDFVPITLLAKTSSCLCVHPSLPVRGVKDFVALAKTRPGKINYGSSGVGVVGHLAIELLATRTGIQLTHVPYKGGALVIVDQIAGNIELSSLQLASTEPFVKQGKLRALGVTSATRAGLMPDVPTVAEQGLPGYECVNWAGILARRGTPAAVVGRIHEVLKGRLETPEARRIFTDQGHDIVVMGPADFDGFLRSEIVHWAKVVKAAGIPRE